MKKRNQNYLDYIPLKSSNISWEKEDEHHVSILITWHGFYHKIAQTFFGRPKTSKISLDDLGSFIWMQIDGKQTVYDISRAVTSEFGEKAEPLLERLIRFLEILRTQKLIDWKSEAD